ncbi:MAG: aminopeptidase P family protein [Anaeroplasmataceae bacterium]|nr:aminopeptidase P family protein [Anaeroplasmataceae bacterium]
MNKIKKFQDLLNQKNIDAYIIPTSDYHNSEYVGDFFKGRAYLTNFTGSAGTLLITKDKAYLWTDGRYHLQAAKQIDSKMVTLMKSGTPGVPTILEFLKNYLKENSVLAFDGKVIPTKTILEYRAALPNIIIQYDIDLLKSVWNARPALPFSMLYRLEDYYAGETFESKIKRIREKMSEYEATHHIIVGLDDQAWLYNLRANDISNTPVFLAYTIITENQCQLFIDERKIDKSIEKYLKDNQITIHPYQDFYSTISNLEDKTILINLNRVNYTIYESIKEKNKIINAIAPSSLMKAIKNETEIKNTIFAHIKDGVSFTKFLYYIKNKIGNDHSMTEMSVTDYLEKLKETQQSFVEPSFTTICAYKEHGAMIHYTATKDTNAHLLPADFLLVDTGGHYLDGTTDTTRTIALGPVSDTQKLHFTTVLKSLIALSEAVFLKGIQGSNLDILARGPLWKELMDYKHGTGHGVGYLLSVHEGPNSFRWQNASMVKKDVVLEPGMITTNEPGLYLENKYGIRIENELLCVPKSNNEFGEFLGFETITYVPIDLDAIDFNLLTKYEKKWLNDYHKKVYENIAPFLAEDEREWLKQNTREIK